MIYEGFSLSTTIYYFSDTGNSLKVAKELVERIPETELVGIPGCLKKGRLTADSENVGIYY